MSSKLNFSKYLSLLVIPIMIMGTAALSRPTGAQAREPINLGFGTATIDGYIGMDEWANSTVLHFDANVPPNDGGGTIPVVFYVMNDDNHKYFALKIGRSPYGGATNPVFNFDTNNNGYRDVEDEHFGMSVGKYSGIRTTDGFYTTVPPCPTGAVCGFSDIDFGGTNDVQSQASFDEEFTYIELSHPLDSSDDLHDISLAGGDVVGFSMKLRLFSLDTACNFGWDCMGDINFPANAHMPIRFASSNRPPIVEPGGPYSGQEGFPITVDGSGSYDPDGDTLSYHWTAQSESCHFSDPNSATPEIICDDNGEFTSILTVDDGQTTDGDTAQIKVYNVPPSVGGISVGPLVSAVGTQINTDADFSDRGREDTHTAVWDWGDGTQSEPVKLNQEPGNGEAFGSHTYTSAGVYTIVLTVTDDDGGSGTSEVQNVVVYDPEGGFVTGGGWFWSRAGTYVPEPNAVGWANFGFVARYRKGAEIPDGQAELVYHTAGMNFHSSSYNWLVVTGNDYAMFKGTGTINGDGEYKFKIWVGDDDPDTFRIKVWYEENGSEVVVYDNDIGQPIGGGSIVIHTKKK